MDNPDIITPGKAPPTIRTVEINRGVEWLITGFRAFFKHPAPLAIAGLALLLTIWLTGMIGPAWMGSSLVTLVGLVAVGVLLRGYDALDKGQDPATAMKLTASLAPLWILGLIGAGLSIGVNMVASLLGIGSLMAGMMAPATIGGLIGINLVVLFALSIGLTMALWLAPALVVLKGANPAQAIRASLMASVRNIVPYIIFTLLAMVACILAALPFGLGLIVVFPVLIIGTYTAYTDIFQAPGAQEGVGYLRD